LANKYEHDIKSFSYRTKVEEEANDVLEAQLANLTSEHMALQATHKELECSHEKLVDPYASLGIAHEVVISSVKFLQPHTHMHTHAHAHLLKDRLGDQRGGVNGSR
jgi:hypothetical protein